MLEKTRGIVLGIIPYNDNSQFVHIYTEKFGKTTYKTSLNKTKKSNRQRNMFVPMTILDMDVEHSNTSELHQIKEATIISSPLSFCSSNPAKYAQCLYIAELTDKSIREVEQNQLLWNFLYTSTEIFLLSDLSLPLFHILFTAKLCFPLGFGIDYSEYKKGMMFDMNDSQFTEEKIYHPYYLNSVSAEYLYKVLCTDYSNIDNLALNSNEQSIMLDILLSYLKLHIPEIGEIRSVEVLKAIIDNRTL